MHPTRPAPWIPPILYGAVLTAGLYAHIAGLGTTNLPLFTGGLLALAATDLAEHHRHPTRATAITLLAARIALTITVIAADGSALARALLVLPPYTAYRTLGRTTGITTAAATITTIAAATTLQHRWDLDHLSDLLMLTVGLILTLTMAAAADNEHLARIRLEHTHHHIADLSATAERHRLARDLHDGLGHHLTAIVIQLEKATAYRDRDPHTTTHAIHDATTSARRALDDLRTAIRATHTLDLTTALTELTAGDPTLTLTITGDQHHHDTTTLTTLYRAAQEAITNTRRHAAATHTTVTVTLDPTHAHLTVTDNGRGFRRGRPTGTGLAGMRERVHLAGGHLDIHTTPGTGTRVTITIPAATR